MGPQNLKSVLARGSDSDSEGCGEDGDKSDQKFVAQKTFVEDSDNDIKDDMITEDEDDDIPLVQLGKEYLSDSKFEKINSWVQGSPFSKRLSDYSSRVQKSPNQTGNDSIEVVESLLLSDPEDGDIVPSWAAPLPPSSSKEVESKSGRLLRKSSNVKKNTKYQESTPIEEVPMENQAPKNSESQQAESLNPISANIEDEGIALKKLQRNSSKRLSKKNGPQNLKESITEAVSENVDIYADVPRNPESNIPKKPNSEKSIP